MIHKPLVLVAIFLLMAVLACNIPITSIDEEQMTATANAAEAASVSALETQTRLFVLMGKTKDASVLLTEEAGDDDALPATPGDSPGLLTFKQAVLTFLLDQATSNLDAYPKPSQGCWPPRYNADDGGHLTVAENGFLDGACLYKRQHRDLQGTLTGAWDPATGKVNFRLDTKGIYKVENSDGNSTWTLVFIGDGSFTSDTQATGSATWSAKCVGKDGANTYFTCASGIKDPHLLEASGTVPWTMDFSP